MCDATRISSAGMHAARKCGSRIGGPRTYANADKSANCGLRMSLGALLPSNWVSAPAPVCAQPSKRSVGFPANLSKENRNVRFPTKASLDVQVPFVPMMLVLYITFSVMPLE
jgi:hypothetical protein